MAIVERLMLVGFGLCIAACLLFSWLAWLFGEMAAKGIFQAATVGAIAGGPVVLWRRWQFSGKKQSIQLAKAANRARYELVNGSQNVVAVDSSTGRPVFNQLAIHPANHRATGAQPLPVQPDAPALEHQRPLLPELLNMDRLLIIGGMGAGKSELLRHLAYQRSMQGETVIIDSHSAPDDWPDSCRVVGRGRQYRQIEAEIGRVMAEMDRRYKLHSAGHGGAFAPLSLIIDELTVLNQFCDVGDEMKALLCECRKVSIRLIFAGQSDRAGALGLRGNYDLKSGFEALVYLEQEADGQRVATVLQGTDKHGRRFPHPGPFPKGLMSQSCLSVSAVSPVYPAETPKDGAFSGEKTDRQDRQTPRIGYHEDAGTFAQFDGPERKFFESKAEKRIIDLFESGFSPSGIAAEIWGAQNGRRTKAVKTVLTKHGIEA